MRGFASLARLAYKSLVEEINKRKMELFDEIDKLSMEIRMKLEEKFRATAKVPENADVRVHFHPRHTEKPIAKITIEFRVDPREVAPQEAERLKELLRELGRLNELISKLRLVIESWKARAIKNGTYFDEPFPAEYYDLLPEELKKVLRREEK